MSTQAGSKEKAKSQPRPIEDMEPVELMKAMGGNGWFNPQSNDHITWQIQDATEEAIPRAIYRMHAWMQWHTTTRSNRQPFANRGGVELYLDHMGRDLGIEMNNLRTYWRLGVRMGIWRGGTKTEGTRRLYLCARVAPVAESEGEKPDGRVCTYPLPTIFQSLRPYMREQLERLEPDVLLLAAHRYARIELVRKVAHAEVLAAVRIVTDQDEDTLWRDLNVEKKRLDPPAKENQSPEDLAEAAERQRRLDALLPHVHGYVQTLSISVQTPPPGEYEVASASVQTRSGGATLLGLETPRKSKSEKRACVSSAPPLASRFPVSKDGEKSGYVPAAETPSPSAEETRSADSFIAGVAGLQRSYRKQFDGKIVDPGNKGDRAWALKIVRDIGIAAVPDFLSYIEHRVVQPGLGHRVGAGMLAEWTGDFRRDAAEQERKLQAAAAAAEKRQAFERAAQQERASEEQLTTEVQRAWSAMTETQRSLRLIAAEGEIKAGKQFDWRLLTPQMQRERAEKHARATLRREIGVQAKEKTDA